MWSSSSEKEQVLLKFFLLLEQLLFLKYPENVLAFMVPEGGSAL